MTTYSRIAGIYLASILLLAACGGALNVLAWSTTPDPFPDTMWNLLIVPVLRVLAGIAGVAGVISAATDPLTRRLLRMHRP